MNFKKDKPIKLVFFFCNLVDWFMYAVKINFVYFYKSTYFLLITLKVILLNQHINLDKTLDHLFISQMKIKFQYFFVKSNEKTPATRWTYTRKKGLEEKKRKLTTLIVSNLDILN